MLVIKSKTSSRLIISFLLIIFIIVSATFFAFLYNARKVDQTVSEITRKGEIINDVLLATFYIREKHEHQAHLIMSGDFSHVKMFEEVAKKTNYWLDRLDSKLKTTKEKEILKKLINVNKSFDKLFYKEVVYSVKVGDKKRTLRAHDKSEKVRAQIILLDNKLIDYLKEEIDLTIKRASTTRTKAIMATIIVIGLTTVLAVLIGLNLNLYIMKPIQALAKGTEYISKGDFTQKIDLNRSDEFGRLADSFNRMTDRLREHQEKLVQSEKLASLGQFAAGVAHEINNPLGVILGYIKVMLKEKGEKDKDYEELKILEEEAQQCKNVVEDLLALSRPVDLSKEAVDIREVIDEELRRLSSRNTENNIEIIKEIDNTPMILLSEKKKLKQVISNLLSNSIEAMPDGGIIRLRVYASPEPTIDTMDDDFGTQVDHFLIMAFSDTGCGISQEDIKRIFDPFFTTKEHGTGLGLSIIYGIIRAHNGLIDVKSTAGEGTTFIVNIPLPQATGENRSQYA